MVVCNHCQEYKCKYWYWYFTVTAVFTYSRYLIILNPSFPHSQELLVTMATTWWRRFWLCSNPYLVTWQMYRWTCWSSQVCSEPLTPRPPWPPAASHRPSECCSDHSSLMSQTFSVQFVLHTHTHTHTHTAVSMTYSRETGTEMTLIFTNNQEVVDWKQGFCRIKQVTFCSITGRVVLSLKCLSFPHFGYSSIAFCSYAVLMIKVTVMSKTQFDI